MSTTKIEKLLFFKTANSTFIAKDEEFLRKHFQIVSYLQKSHSVLGVLFMFMRQFLFLIRHIWNTQKIFIWFADYHSFLPILFSKIFGKQTFLVLGGADTIYIKELGYGVYSNILRSFSAKYSVKNADYLLPVDESLLIRLRDYVDDWNGKYVVVPTGYDSKKWFCNSEKKDLVITVASFQTLQRIKIKGLNFFAKVAKEMPALNFIILGAHGAGEELLGPIPNNLTILPHLSSDVIRQYLSESKVYAQFSLSEGLPNVVCEAMLTECIPVCTSVGGMPKLIKNLGVLIENQNLDDAKEAIKEAINLSNEKSGIYCRELILNNYSQENRNKSLIEILAGNNSN